MSRTIPIRPKKPPRAPPITGPTIEEVLGELLVDTCGRDELKGTAGITTGIGEKEEVKVAVSTSTDPSGSVVVSSPTITVAAGVTVVVIKDSDIGGEDDESDGDGWLVKPGCPPPVFVQGAKSVLVGDACVIWKTITIGTCTVLGPPASNVSDCFRQKYDKWERTLASVNSKSHAPF